MTTMSNIHQPNNPMQAALDAVARHNTGMGTRMGTGSRVLPPSNPGQPALSAEEQFARDWGHTPGDAAPGVGRPDATTDEPIPYPEGVQPQGPLAPVNPPPEMLYHHSQTDGNQLPQGYPVPQQYPPQMQQPAPVQMPVQMQQAPAPPPPGMPAMPLRGFTVLDFQKQVIVGDNGEVFPVPEPAMQKLNQFAWEIMIFIRNLQAAQLRESMGLPPVDGPTTTPVPEEASDAGDTEQPAEEVQEVPADQTAAPVQKRQKKGRR
jgi:hypothetical protein